MDKEPLSFGQPNDNKGSASLTVKELPVQALELDQDFEDVEIEVGWRTWRMYLSSCLAQASQLTDDDDWLAVTVFAAMSCAFMGASFHFLQGLESTLD